MIGMEVWSKSAGKATEDFRARCHAWDTDPNRSLDDTNGSILAWTFAVSVRMGSYSTVVDNTEV